MPRQIIGQAADGACRLSKLRSSPGQVAPQRRLWRQQVAQVLEALAHIDDRGLCLLQRTTGLVGQGINLGPDGFG